MSHSQRSQSNEIKGTTVVTFHDQLKFVLETIADPVRLGAESPLAQPYFLSSLTDNPTALTTALGRGNLLCSVLNQAVIDLWPEPLPADHEDLLERASAAKDARGFCDQYHFLLLDLTYIHRYFPEPSKQSEIYRDVLHVSRATYDRHLRDALRRLGEILLLRLQPTLHIEQPGEPPLLFGRDAIAREAHNALEAKQSVYLCGVSGIGKSALGAALAEQWSTPAIFWFTVRLTLNDQLTSLLFALGNFMHRQGASRLWLQLIANGGIMQDANLALELTRADLADLMLKPLLCFDEIDLLRPQNVEKELIQHTQFLAFVEGLQGHAAILLMGQRPVLSTDTVYRLPPLSSAELMIWLADVNIEVTPDVLARFNAYTAGNPRLVALCLALFRTMIAHVPSKHLSTMSDVLDQLPQTPALAPIWQRLQLRLSPQEQLLLQALSVFRSTAPRDAWTLQMASTEAEPDAENVESALATLQSYLLIHEDGLGGVSVVPSLREVIYHQLVVERREDLHLQAGAIRAERGEYTAAVYHYHLAGRPELAIELWESNAQQEVRRGQVTAALAIFEEISGNRLDEVSARKLRLLRGQLYQLAGNSAQALTEVEPISEQDDEAVDAAIVAGDALRTMGQSDAALMKYGTGLSAAARLLQQRTWLHAKRGTIYLQQRELNDARREALHARYCLQNLEGAIHETAGNYAVAREHYLKALDAAKLLDDKGGLALIQRNLGVLATHQGDRDNAIRYHEEALAFYEEIGDRVNAAEVLSNLAGLYVQFDEFNAAIVPAEKALRFFSARQNSYWIAQNTSNLATAHFELKDFAKAQAYAERTLEQEEPQSYPYALFTLGQIYAAQEQWLEANAHFERVRQIAEQSEDRFLLKQLEALLETTTSAKSVTL